MELIRSDEFYILQHVQKGETNLWISRQTGEWQVRPSWDLAGQENLECLGLVWALYGKLSIHPDLPDRLVLVKHCDRVAELPGVGGHQSSSHAVYRVTGAVMISLDQSTDYSHDLDLKPCPKHHVGAMNHPGFEATTEAGGGAGATGSSKIPFGKIGGSLKSLATDTIKSTAGNLAANLDVKSTAKKAVSKARQFFFSKKK